MPRELSSRLDHQYRKRYVFTEHHESHAASAFFPSPFEEAAILTFDGVGEWATTSYGVGRGNHIELLAVRTPAGASVVPDQGGKLVTLSASFRIRRM